MSPSNLEALEAIGDELRTLPSRGDSPAARLESAGRLLIAAMESGAFAEPRSVGFRAMVRQRNEQTDVNGFISAWSEAVWRMKGRPKETPALAGDLASDVELVIDQMRESLRSQALDRTGQGCPATDLAKQLAALRPSCRKAYLQRCLAQQHCPDLEAEHLGDEAAHEWLMEHCDEEGERLASLKTWTRYLRKARYVLRQLSVADDTTTPVV